MVVSTASCIKSLLVYCLRVGYLEALGIVKSTIKALIQTGGSKGKTFFYDKNGDPGSYFVHYFGPWPFSDGGNYPPSFMTGIKFLFNAEPVNHFYVFFV
jgi:hypothetical protein